MNAEKKNRRGTQLTAIEVLVYRATISEPTPLGVSIDTYHPVAKITSFQWRVSKRMLQYFLFEESQIYVI
jgi:hypothetical protein